MPTSDSSSKEPKEFLIVLVPSSVKQGTTLRLLGVEKTQAAAEKAVEKLDSAVLGRVAVLERKALFTRQQTVESVSSPDAIAVG